MHELDDALLGEFLAECREHLADIENDLLLMEEGGADIDEQLVNKVFRAAHSMKGGAGFFNLTKIQELAHRTENVLDMVRSREMVPTADVINILLQAFDRLREMINRHAESNEEDIAEIIVALSGLASANLPAEEKQSLTREVVLEAAGLPEAITVSEFDLDRMLRAGRFVYILQIDLLHDVQRRGKTPLDILHVLLDHGDLLDARLDLESAGTLEEEPGNELILRVAYASSADPTAVEKLVEIPAERIQVLEIPGTKPAAQPVAAPKKKARKPSKRKAVVAVAATEEEPQLTQVVVPATPAAVREPNAAAVPRPAPKPVRAASGSTGASGGNGDGDFGKGGAPDATLRVQVGLLESLMNLAGELVLSRNQLNEAIGRDDLHAIRAGGQRLSLVTSELQEAVMQTRMQPIGNLFGKFPRLVRDLSRELGKDVQIELIGRDVEMDKTLIEGLSDPLTHMVRNAVDHGIEGPDLRITQGKPPGGMVRLRAYHEAGQVVVEIIDDGKGIDTEKVVSAAVSRGQITRDQAATMSDREKRALIFLPGLSTAQQVTDVSGRGVGMDVVKTNLDRLGGTVEIDSEPGQGSTFRIKLPLTLAIIPSLLLSVGEERFALPQVNVGEMLRISAREIAKRIEVVGDAEVIVLRNTLIPVVDLSLVLGLERAMEGPSRLRDRRAALGQDLKIVVVSSGTFLYGLVVDELHDNLEIVVKPLGRHLKGLRHYAGATILGDGRVALILDAGGVAAAAQLTSLSGTDRARELAIEAQRDEAALTNSFLVFDNGPEERCAVPLHYVKRLERIDVSQVEWIGGRRTMQYRGASLPLVTLADVGAGQELGGDRELVVIVFHLNGNEIGLVAAMPVDVLETRAVIDTVTLRRTGISGSAQIRERTTLVVDVIGLVQAAWPGWQVEPEAEEVEAQAVGGAESATPLLLLAEDSVFFRAQVTKILEEAGYRVAAAEDGEAAWGLLEKLGDEVQLVVTDIEMPNLDGLGFTRRIRGDGRFKDLPVITLSSLAGEDDIARGKAAGVDSYQIKLDREKLLESVRSLLDGLALAA